MLIRSQDKLTILPFERFVLAVTLDNKIIACRRLSVRPSEAANCIIGGYSTREKAVKVLDMVQEAYQYAEEYKVTGEGLSRPEFVFQMPQDDDNRQALDWTEE